MLCGAYKKISRKKEKTNLQKNDHIKLLCIAKAYKLGMVNINTAKNQHKNPQKVFSSAVLHQKNIKAKMQKSSPLSLQT